MKKQLLRGLCVALLCGAWAGAETLDEAVARLAKAAAETRDVTIKFTIQGARYQMPDGGGKAVKSRTMSGTGEFQMLRDGDKCLMRATASITEERPAKDPAAAPEKREQSLLAVNDGQFSWKEERRSGQDEARVRKEAIPDGGGLDLGRGAIASLDAPYKTTGIKGELDKAEDADVKVVGKGSVAGRPTTIIEVAVKAERLQSMDEAQRVMRPVRSVVQFDDATGAAVRGQDFNGAGDEVMGFAATEVRANAGLDKKLFAYTPPEGAKVRDQTQPAKDAAP
ncbi:MAG TPA: hypothetical protein VNE39_12720 [Planctomycetota bacterium]|nr:hypothetical protein [Planctomycetota bacterium]